MAIPEFWDIEDGKTPGLASVFGETVRWSGVLPNQKVFVFACGFYIIIVEVSAVRAPHRHSVALKITIGTARDIDGVIRDLEPETVQSPHARALIGLPFAGLDGNVLQFGSDKGVRIGNDGVRFVPTLKRS